MNVQRHIGFKGKTICHSNIKSGEQLFQVEVSHKTCLKEQAELDWDIDISLLVCLGFLIERDLLLFYGCLAYE